MKRIIYIASVIAMVACGGNKQETDNKLQEQRDSLQAIIDAKDSELDDIMNTFNEVQLGIQNIAAAEGRVTVADNSPESAGNKEIILDNMRYIQEMMNQNRQLIEQLKEKVSASTINAKKLNETIAALQAQVNEQAARIQELQAQLAEKDIQIIAQGEEIVNLNSNVMALTEENKEKAATVAAQDADLNTAYFVFGTKRELENQKILYKGDVLKKEDFAKDYFEKIDVREKKNIKFYSKSAKILTSHPAGSYNLVKDAKGEYELHITDYKKFWSVSKYLVVLVK